MKLTLQTIESAPENSRPLLEGVAKSLGFIPNLFATFANSPAVLQGYVGLSAAFAKSAFSATEQQVIAIATSVENDCHYCVAAHTTIGQMQKVDAAVLESLRGDQPISNPKLEALRVFTKAVVNQHGHVGEAEQADFLGAGYTPAQALEVVLGVAMKILSNYIVHLAGPPLEAAFAANSWQPASAACTGESCACSH